MSDEIDKILENQKQERHSIFQLKYFLIGKEPTNQAKMWRCIDELKARKQSTDAIKLEIEDANDDLELLNMKEAAITETTAVEQQIARRKLKRKIAATESRLSELAQRLKGIEEESSFLVKAFNSINQIEELKPFDDLESQKNYWSEKLGQELNLRLLLGMALDMELVKTILALHSESTTKQELLGVLDGIKAKIEQRNKKVEYDAILNSTRQELIEEKHAQPNIDTQYA